MATRYFNVESDEEALSLSVSARRLVGGDGIATLQWSLDETSSRGFAVYVAWTGGDITCGVVQTEGASLPPVHLKMPTASCGQPLDGWYHLEIASNGSTLAFLVNGVEQVSEQSSDSMQSSGFGAEQSVMDDTAFAAQFDDLILRDAA